jgi:arginine decarboxylase
MTTRSKTTNILIGSRIPKDYFVTSGIGESDIQIHAGSYHLAMKDAGIETYNIMNYSSILPGIAREVKRPKNNHHGAVMELISAVSHSTKGKRATAGVIYGWLYNKKTGKKYGGLVCEHNGNFTVSAIEKSLRLSLNELYTNGFSQDYDLKEITFLHKTIVPKKKYGTAMVAICFVNYKVPVLR